MRLDHKHRGYVLYGKFRVRPYNETVIRTVLEDTTGRGIAMTICYDSDDVVEKCRFGQKVAVKEPYLLTNTDGRISLRVENPKDIEVVTKFPSETSGDGKSEAGNGVPGGAGAADDGDGWLGLQAPPDFLRSEGNRQFAERNFEGAITYYGLAIASCDEFSKENQDARKRQARAASKKLKKKKDKGTNDHGEGGSPPDQKEASGWTDAQLSTAYALAYSNRAEAWLRLGKYKEAHDDCVDALRRDPTHQKSLVRHEKALRGLEA